MGSATALQSQLVNNTIKIITAGVGAEVSWETGDGAAQLGLVSAADGDVADIHCLSLPLPAARNQAGRLQQSR